MTTNRPTHTPEPWLPKAPSKVSGLASAGLWRIVNQDGETIAKISQSATEEQDAADAARIVACVNACAGINPEAVPDMLDALRAIAAACSAGPNLEGKRSYDEQVASAAIAKATGGGK
jgi:hypothetical protein